MKKATVADVRVGLFTIKGLLGDDGEFYVGVPQINEEFQFLKHNASRELKTLMGETFQFLKAKTALNPKAINVVSLKDFERLLFELSLKGNSRAIDICRSLVGLSLHQLFCDAFDLKFDAEDRQVWLKHRLQGKATRRTLTDAIKTYIEANNLENTNYAKFIYSNISDRLNLGIFNRRSHRLKEDWDLKPTENIRDYLNKDELRWLEQCEDLAMRLIDLDQIEPMVAMNEAIERLRIPSVRR